MILWILIFILSLAVLLKASERFTDSMGRLTKAIGWSSFFVGMTVMAIGTSLPELTSSLWAVYTKTTTLVASNVVGSNITNILLIAGLGAVIFKRIELNRERFRSMTGLLLASTFLLIVTVYNGVVTWYEGVLLIATYGIYAAYNADEHKAGHFDQLKDWIKKEDFSPRLLAEFVLSAIVMAVSSYFVILGLENISSLGHILPSVLGATALAIGTSLPELFTTLFALKKGDSDLAIGNLIGSNVFNATIVLGIPALFHSLTVSNDVLVLGIPFTLMATLLIILAVGERKVSIYEGILYLILYSLFFFQLLTF